jgi:hypothetical protein
LINKNPALDFSNAGFPVPCGVLVSAINAPAPATRRAVLLNFKTYRRAVAFAIGPLAILVNLKDGFPVPIDKNIRIIIPSRVSRDAIDAVSVAEQIGSAVEAVLE